MVDEKALPNALPARAFPPVHPILFAVWPALALYSENVEKISFAVVAVPLLVYAGIGAVLPIAFRPITSNWAKASLLATVTIIALCDIWKPIAIDYLLFYSALDPWVFYSLYGLFLLLALAFIQQSRAGLQGSAPILNIVAVVMIVWPTFQISRVVASNFLSPHREATQPLDLPGNMANVTHKPNVVLLILDEYSRADFLEEKFGFDNHEFIQALEQRGFIVALNSMSNYPGTTLSIPSALNMDYLSSLTEDGNGRVNHRALIENNLVLRLFDAMGYETFAFSTGFPVTEPGPIVDHILPAHGSLVTMTEFLGLLLQLSPVHEITEALDADFTYRIWRNNILHTLHNLHRPIAEAGERPVYVRAHVVSPHPPYVFDANGEPRHPKGPFSLLRSREPQAKNLLVEQTRGLNKHVLRAVDEVLAASKEPPIIIITADHATAKSQLIGRGLEILFAAYLPGKGQQVPREDIDSIHLVNLFRIIFNTYFGAEYPMLENKGLEDGYWSELIPHGEA